MPFVGRAALLATAAERLDAGARLLVLVGPPGAGKTRLARELLRRRRSRGAPLIADLQACRCHDDVVAALLAALGATLERPNARVLAAALAEREQPVVLDDAEGLDDAGVLLIGALLDADPALRLIVTSRRILGLTDETVIDVGPLSPDDAWALWCERGKSVGARAVALQRSDDGDAFLSRLDRLPLSICLCAPRLRTLELSALAGFVDDALLRLGAGLDRHPRHRSLDAAIDASFVLLTKDAQAALLDASAARGPWDVPLFAAVTGQDIERAGRSLHELLSTRWPSSTTTACSAATRACARSRRGACR